MSPLNYNPEDKVDTVAEAGQYRFFVGDAVETTFRSGNEGLKITLEVAAFEDRDIKVFENLVYMDKALWRLEEFLTSVGLDYSKPPELDQLHGLEGMAEFVLGDKKQDGRQYLEVAAFLAPDASQPGSGDGPGNLPPRGKSEAAAPPATEPDEDDVPF